VAGNRELKETFMTSQTEWKDRVQNVQGDSKLLSEFPWPVNRNPYNNLESACIIRASMLVLLHDLIVTQLVKEISSFTDPDVSSMIPYDSERLDYVRWNSRNTQHNRKRHKHVNGTISLYGSAVLLLDLGRFLSFLIYTQSVELLGRGSARRRAATYTQNKRTYTFIPGVGFEPTIPVFEWAKTVHASDGAATVTGMNGTTYLILETQNGSTTVSTNNF
jgi:hypothetical protein